MASKHSFPSSTQNGLDSLRTKQAIIDSFIPNKINALINGQARNPGFYESVAKVIASSYLPFNPVKTESGDGPSDYIKSKSETNGINTDKKGVSYDFTSEGTILSDKGLLGGDYHILLSNLSLFSEFTQRNFFSKKKEEPTEAIFIDCPIATLSYSYSNKFSESTPVGMQGSVKESMGSSNLKINIEGVFTSRYIGMDPNNPTQNFAGLSEDLMNFQKMCVRNKVVSVDSPFIADLTIFNDIFKDCVIKSFTLPGDNSSKNLQRFTLVLESDKPLIIK